MAREGVTLAQVVEAVEELEEQGHSTSLRRIRATLGEGSLTTIANHKKELNRQRQLEHLPLDSDRPPLPDPVVKALFRGAESTWSELLAAAEDLIDKTEKSAEEKINEAKDLAQHALEQRDEAESENVKLREALERSADESSVLKQTVDTLKAKHQELETYLASERTKIGGLNTLVAELKRSKEQLTTDVNSADRRTEISEERVATAERTHNEILESLRAKFTKERGALEKQRGSEKQRADMLYIQLTSTQSDLAKISGQLSGQREALEITKSQLKRTLKDLDARTRERDIQSTEIAKLQERCASLGTELKRDREQSEALVSEKEKRITEQATSIRDLTAAFKRAQTMGNKTS